MVISSENPKNVIGGSKRKIGDLSQSKRGHLKSAFKGPSVKILKKLSTSPFINKIIDAYKNALTSDHQYVVIFFNPKNHNIECSVVLNEAELDFVLDEYEPSELSSPQPRFAINVDKPFLEQLPFLKSSKLHTVKEMLDFLRQTYEEKFGEYFFDSEKDNILPEEIGPYSLDINILMNVFERIKSGFGAMPQLCFYADQNREIKTAIYMEEMSFEKIRNLHATAESENNILMLLDLNRAFDDQLFDIDLTAMSFDDLQTKPIDTVYTNGFVDLSTLPPAPKNVIWGKFPTPTAIMA